MEQQPTLYYFNALFDLQMAGQDVSGLSGQVAEMATLFLTVGSGADRVLLDLQLPQGYRDYLRSHGLDCAAPARFDERLEGFRGEPWGWNPEAVEVLGRCGATIEPPSLDIVRRVNGREFHHRMAMLHGFGVPGACSCASIDDLDRLLERWDRFPAVIKESHGNAGSGFLHVSTPQIDSVDRKRLAAMFERSASVIVEPWLERTLDIGSRCWIDRQGTVSPPHHHQIHTNRAGTFFAHLLCPGDPQLRPWRDKLNAAVEKAAAALASEGYWGPVGFDSFVWRDPQGSEQLAPVIEINARHTMSAPAYALRDRLAPDKVCYFRLIARRRHRLPSDESRLKLLLGEDCFDPQRREGVLLVTPVRVGRGGGWIQPARSAFFLAASTQEELFAMDTRLRTILAPHFCR